MATYLATSNDLWSKRQNVKNLTIIQLKDLAEGNRRRTYTGLRSLRGACLYQGPWALATKSGIYEVCDIFSYCKNSDLVSDMIKTFDSLLVF